MPITNFNATGYGDGVTIPVTGDFSANMLFEVSDDNGATWTPATEYFQAHSCCNIPPPPLGEQNSFNAGFFYLFNSHLALSPNPVSFGTVQLGQSSAPMTQLGLERPVPVRRPGRGVQGHDHHQHRDGDEPER